MRCEKHYYWVAMCPNAEAMIDTEPRRVRRLAKAEGIRQWRLFWNTKTITSIHGVTSGRTLAGVAGRRRVR